MDRTVEDIEDEIYNSQRRLRQLSRGGDYSDINREKMYLGQLYADLDDRRDMDEDDRDY